ncbi:MAG: threonine/serine dehydratase [Gemmatimonadaceae bacterium]|nr:threonine/serine dehydratase [Gemmatimonadaceae bacterium]
MSVTTAPLVDLPQFEAAAARLRGVALRTPLLPLDVPAGRFPHAVWLKAECLQRVGAFKVRGAFHYVASMDPEVRSRGLLAPSSGNHAQAVAWAARHFGVPCTVVMPTTVSPVKAAGSRRLGATVELVGTTTLERIARANELAALTGAVVVPPFDDDLIIAGQGTAGLEIVDDLPDVATVVVPVGGGGLASGVAAAVKARKPSVRVVCVEPAGAPKLSRALAAGGPVTLDGTHSLADGLLGVRLGDRNWDHLSALVDDVVQVGDGAIKCTMRYLLDRQKLAVEPSGAITLAAVLEDKVASDGPIVAVLSGGNIEWDGLAALVADQGPDPSVPSHR